MAKPGHALPGRLERVLRRRSLAAKAKGLDLDFSKEAHVVEEVSLRKTAAEHEETVPATARRTNVEVEEIDLDELQQRKQ